MMKPALVLTLILAAHSVRAEIAPLPLFSGTHIDASPRTLLESAQKPATPLAPLPRSSPTAKKSPPSRPARLISRMPIIDGGANVDPHLALQAPKDSVDYKLTVKTPDLESVP